MSDLNAVWVLHFLWRGDLSRVFQLDARAVELSGIGTRGSSVSSGLLVLASPRAKVQGPTVARMESLICIFRPSVSELSRTAPTALKSSVVGRRQKPFLVAPLL